MAKNNTSPKTTSRCLMEGVTTVHDFEVTSYELLDGIGPGRFVRSCNFSVAGYEWFISFFPDGWTLEYAGYASVFLERVIEGNDAHLVRTKFTLNILEKDGEAQITSFDVIGIGHAFSRGNSYLGYPKFVEKSKLKSLSQVINGYFIIRCVLTVIKEPRTELRMKTVVVPQPNLHDQLWQMCKDGQGADVTFSVCDQLFNAHRCLLAARSPVFKAELFGPMKEKETQCIKIDDMDPHIFEALLHFVYTDFMLDDGHYKEGKVAKLQHLLVAADRYGLDRLKVMCESKLCEGIDVETVATTLVLAEQHHCMNLQKACIEFMAPRSVLRAVMATEGFKHLLASSPLVMKEILDMVSLSD
ncbi:BTB/POZ and MATH domain-containing protein 1-like [Lolium rigidum]|uniref:BTB/POZ and MATH domain-containing protein 1-like n=1 Tax=Lolium rigidum TaxID=89674 RepID=UPI001F5D0690|nr:BTB/POZ and MATH domain-containing protein 1-like [Lolium rigidum]